MSQSWAWRKSSRSSEQGDQCVEIAVIDGMIAVRDSKNPSRELLIFDRITWRSFATSLKRIP